MVRMLVRVHSSRSGGGGSPNVLQAALGPAPRPAPPQAPLRGASPYSVRLLCTLTRACMCCFLPCVHHRSALSERGVSAAACDEVAQAYGACVAQLRELHGGPGAYTRDGLLAACLFVCVVLMYCGAWYSRACVMVVVRVCIACVWCWGVDVCALTSGLPLPRLVDVEWRLDYVARSSSADLAHQPQYLVKLTTACSGE
jgi:hypothetical protein